MESRCLKVFMFWFFSLRSAPAALGEGWVLRTVLCRFASVLNFLQITTQPKANRRKKRLNRPRGTQTSMCQGPIFDLLQGPWQGCGRRPVSGKKTNTKHRSPTTLALGHRGQKTKTLNSACVNLHPTPLPIRVGQRSCEEELARV